MNKNTEKHWAILFLGNEKEKAGICWWNGHAAIYESRIDALNARDKEFKDWGYSGSDKRLFKVVRCEISYSLSIRKKKN